MHPPFHSFTWLCAHSYSADRFCFDSYEVIYCIQGNDIGSHQNTIQQWGHEPKSNVKGSNMHICHCGSYGCQMLSVPCLGWFHRRTKGKPPTFEGRLCLTHGLYEVSIPGIASTFREMGFNCVRFPWSVWMARDLSRLSVALFRGPALSSFSSSYLCTRKHAGENLCAMCAMRTLQRHWRQYSAEDMEPKRTSHLEESVFGKGTPCAPSDWLLSRGASRSCGE